MIFRANVTLMNVTTATSDNQNGATHRLYDEVDGVDNKFRLFYELTQTGTQTSSQGNPYTTTLTVQHSADGSQWMDLVTAEVLASNTTARKFIEIPAMMQYVRAQTVVPGTSKPTHVVTVRLLSNGTFRYQVGTGKILRAG
jgi:hypothetical protein